jgi:hypothetical protein
MGVLVKILEMLRESVLVQASIALVLVGSASYIAVNGAEPPRWMIDALMLVLGFYFGSKVSFSACR